MAGFGLPNFGQLTEAFKKAQQIQQNAQKLQEELEVMEIEGTNDDNRAKIWMSGNQKPLRVEIDPSHFLHIILNMQILRIFLRCLICLKKKQSY